MFFGLSARQSIGLHVPWLFASSESGEESWLPCRFVADNMAGLIKKKDLLEFTKLSAR